MKVKEFKRCIPDDVKIYLSEQCYFYVKGSHCGRVFCLDSSESEVKEWWSANVMSNRSFGDGKINEGAGRGSLQSLSTSFLVSS